MGVALLVALAAFAAAPMAKESGLKIGIQAMKIALPGFVIPYMAVYDPTLMLQPVPGLEGAGYWLAVVYIVVKASLAMVLWGVAIILLTLLVRTVTFPLTIAQTKASVGMAAHAPAIQKIREDGFEGLVVGGETTTVSDAATGEVRDVMTERDSAWLDVVNDFQLLDDGRRFLWISERDGWRHLYSVALDGSSTKLLTEDAFDVIPNRRTGPAVPVAEDFMYVMASPEYGTQRYLYRYASRGGGRRDAGAANAAGDAS